MSADPTEPVDLAELDGEGPLWGLASDDLNATLLSWPAGHAIDEHVNAGLDVLLIVLDGGGTVHVDGRPHSVGTGEAMLIEKGTRRSITAGPDGLRYLSIHRRRGPLQIERGK